MGQTVLTIAAMCMLAAICSQLMNSSGYMHAVRIVLGLEIFRCGLKLMQNLAAALK